MWMKNIWPWRIFDHEEHLIMKNIWPWRIFDHEEHLTLKNICSYEFFISHSIICFQSHLRYSWFCSFRSKLFYFPHSTAYFSYFCNFLQFLGALTDKNVEIIGNIISIVKLLRAVISHNWAKAEILEPIISSSFVVLKRYLLLIFQLTEEDTLRLSSTFTWLLSIFNAIVWFLFHIFTQRWENFPGSPVETL